MLISIMQGRLLPPLNGKIQAFPLDGWEKEFELASELGLYSIEWIYEAPNVEVNPLSTTKGIEYLKNIIQKTGVAVKSVCADYYMQHRLIEDNIINEDNLNHLLEFIKKISSLDITYIVLPFVDSSSLKSDLAIENLVKILPKIINIAQLNNIEIHLETDLPIDKLLTIFTMIDSNVLKLNYDIGNSASLGYEPDQELSILGKYLGSVHIKDRLLGGHSVALGSGNADFKKCFRWFNKLNFSRWYVLQVARNISGFEKEYIAKVMKLVKEMRDGAEFKE